jgi:hypothetical protein
MIPQKIAHMIRTACASGTPAEAANAALMACRARMASGVIPKDSTEPAQESRERPSGSFNAKGYTELTARLGVLEREKRDLVAANQRLVAQIEDLKNPPKCITAKFSSHCRECNEIISKNEKCWWQPGVKGAVCLSCGHK